MALATPTTLTLCNPCLPLIFRPVQSYFLCLMSKWWRRSPGSGQHPRGQKAAGLALRCPVHERGREGRRKRARSKPRGHDRSSGTAAVANSLVQRESYLIEIDLQRNSNCQNKIAQPSAILESKRRSSNPKKPFCCCRRRLYPSLQGALTRSKNIITSQSFRERNSSGDELH